MSDPTIQESLKVAGAPSTNSLWQAIGRWGRATEGEMARQASLLVDEQIAELLRAQSESDLALMREAVEALESAKFVIDVGIGMHLLKVPDDADGPVVQIPAALSALRQRVGGQG